MKKATNRRRKKTNATQCRPEYDFFHGRSRCLWTAAQYTQGR